MSMAFCRGGGIFTLLTVMLWHVGKGLITWRVTFFLQPLEQRLGLPGQRAEVGLAAHVVVDRGADPQVVQQQPERRVQGGVPEVLAVLIQPCLDEGQQRAAGGGGSGRIFTV